MAGVCQQVSICLTVVAALCFLKLDSVTSKNTKHDEVIEEEEFESVFFETRVEVGAGGTQCFFQKLRQDAKLYVTFEVNK